MKKFILSIILALLIGTSLAYIFYNKFNSNEEIVNVNNTFEEVYAIQVGVFSNLENANTLASKYGGIVLLDDNKYRVYIDIASSSISVIKNYYDKLGISYYVKQIEVNKDFYNTLIEYENKLLDSDQKDYELIIKDILIAYEKSNNK